MEEIRETGARIKYITDGDVAGAIMAARPDTGVDLMLGVGGTPEGIITACAMKCIGGKIQGQLWPQDDDERQRALDAGHNLDPDFVLGTDDLVTGDDAFFVATGITDGELMRGVRYRGDHVVDALAGDALAQRHGPLDHRRAPALEATRSLHDRLRQLTRTAGRSAADTDGDDGGVERHAHVGRAHLDRAGDRVDAGPPVDDAVAPGVDRGEVDVGRQLGAGLGEALLGAVPGHAVLGHQVAHAGAVEPHQQVDAAGERHVVGAGREHRAAHRDDAGDEVGAAGRDAAGEHPAEAVPDDPHARAAALGDLLEPLLELRRRRPACSRRWRGCRRDRCGSPGGAATCSSGPSEESPARKPGTSSTGSPIRTGREP